MSPYLAEKLKQEIALQQVAEREKAAYQAQMAQTSGASIGGAYASEPKRSTLAERIGMDLHSARRQSARRERLEELSFLLDKNPEIARILDLLEDVKG